MATLFERSFLMALGAAVLTKEMASDLADELFKKGESTTSEGKKVIDEAVESAKEQTRTLKTHFDASLERNFKDMGLATSKELEEINLKLAQLEHRITLLESDRPATMSFEDALAGGVSPAEASAEYHHMREEEAEAEALNPHLDMP